MSIHSIGNIMDANHELMASEIKQLRALLTQAPIAKVTVRESGAGHYAPDDVSVSLYAPGLPPGEYDLYLMPEVPQSGHTPRSGLDTVSGNGYSMVHGKDDSRTTPGAPRQTR